MIVKIWPIKADYNGQAGKVGGIEGVKNAIEYITDPEKVLANDEIFDDVPHYEYDKEEIELINSEENFDRVLNYMENEDKTLKKYITTYLCNDEDPAASFVRQARLLEVKSGGKINANFGAVAFHMVQSFPENLNISDEEVHECGIELVKKLGKYQAVICSHVHPVLDEKGEVHGRCKHNHILINAYIHPDFYDPSRPELGKYHDCTETYHQLQIYNDEIAIDHGLPIIRAEDLERTYSWKESSETNKGTSWKGRVKMDLDTYRRVTENWNEFVKVLRSEGYDVKDQKHVTYITPDGNKIRGGTLGTQYTKESLEMYWAIRDRAKNTFKQDFDANNGIILSDFVYAYDGELSVKIPLGPQYVEDRQFKLVPLNKDTKGDEEAFRSYFKMDQLYDICDDTGHPVVTASGIEIFQSIEELRDEELMIARRRRQKDEEEIRRERQDRERERLQNRNYFYNQNFRNSRTGRPYCCSYYDEDGRARSGLELIYVLALVVLDKEAYLWVPRGDIPQDQENEIFFAKTNVKIQNLVDSIEMAKEENVDTPAELDRRLNSVGAAYSRSKKAYNNTFRAAERMEPLGTAIKTYRETQKIAEGIAAMPEGDDKVALQKKYAGAIEEYKMARHIMHIHKVVSEDAIRDFEQRYQKIVEDVAKLEARMKEEAERYRNLKKMSYSLQLAQDPYYIYGPSYPGPGFKFGESEPENEHLPLWHKLESVKTQANQAQTQARTKPEQQKDI